MKDSQLPVPYKKQSLKKSLFYNINEIFHSDIVWYSVALGCVLGVVLFFFQGLQPVLLRSYIFETKETMISLQDTYISQIDQVRALQSDYVDKFDYSLGDLCEDQERYTSFAADAERQERLKVFLLPQQKPDLDSYITLREVENAYNRLQNTYEDQIDQIQSLANGFAGMPAYLNYINGWIESCQILESASGLNSEVREVCSQTQDSYLAYQASTQPFFWNDVKELHETSLQLCDDLGDIPDSGFSVNFFSFKLEWLSNFTRIRQYVPDLFTYLSPVDSLVADFLVIYEETDIELQEILRYRNTFGGMWYVARYF
jgi:hypothetical protein